MQQRRIEIQVHIHQWLILMYYLMNDYNTISQIIDRVIDIIIRSYPQLQRGMHFLLY